MPRARNESSTSQTEQEYIIAQRTRSKVSLAETPIEAIESNFKAPDVPIDFYGNTDLDPDDLPWSEFMFNYRFDQGPDHEEDEDGDPDYIVGDKAPVDKEELRQPKVPKKELEDLLVAHEIDVSDNNWWNDFLAIEFGEQSTEASNANTPVPVTSDAASTETSSAIFTNTIATPETTNAIKMSIGTAPPTSYFDPTKISTSTHPYAMPTDLSGHFEQRTDNISQIFDNSKVLSIAPVTNTRETYSHAVSSFNVSSLKDRTFASAIESNATPHSSMPSGSTTFILLLPAEAMAGSVSTTALTAQNNLPLNTLNRQIEGGPLQRIARPKRTRFKKCRFSELENSDPQHVATREVRNPFRAHKFSIT